MPFVPPNVASLKTLIQDLRYAVRLARRSPGLTAAVTVALALGVGANTAIFSVVNSVLLRPLPFRDSERLVVVWESSPGQGWNRIGPSGPNYLDFRDQNQSFADMAIMEPGSGTITGFGEPQQVPGMRVSVDFLTVLGVRPVQGRDFLPEEGWNQRVVIISDTLRERCFGRDPGVVGRRIILDALSYTIVGVLPRGFWFPVPAEALVPWADSDLRARDRMDHNFGVIGHLKPGLSVKQAAADLAIIERRIAEQVVGMKDWGVIVVPMHEALAENVRTSLWLLLVAVALVLLIACANLANLLLARAAARTREVAVRMALGAGRCRLVRQFLTESAVLGLMGGVLGLLLAMWGVDLLERVVPQTIRLAEGAGEVVRPAVGVDGRVLVFALLISLATSVVFGLAPALAASRTKMNEPLKQSGRSSSPGGRRLRSLLVVSEVAVALVLLIGSILMLRSLWRIQQVDPGFAADHVLVMEMELPTDSKYRTGVEQAEFFRRVLENVQGLPAVRRAAVTSVLPLDPAQEDTTGFLIEGRPPLPSGQRLPADYRTVSTGYFLTMKIPLLKGRSLSEQDAAGRPPVAVISESLARRHWPDGSDPIGRRLLLGRNPREIVGIVGDVKHAGLERGAAPTIYTSYLQSPGPRMNLVVGTTVEPASMIRTVKSAIYAVDRDQPIYKIRTMERVLQDCRASSRTTLFLLGIFAAVALALAAAGIYGVISYAVAQRTREIGIRVALGAQRDDILRLVLGQGMALSLAGVAGGLAAALALTRLMASLLFGVSALDPTTFAVAPLFVALVALAASYLPARRATRLDPAATLRYQ